MNIAAVVIARKGSVRVPGKMHRKIGEDTLLIRKVKQLRASTRISEVYVGTDDLNVLDDISKLGAKFVLRAPEYCDEKSVTVNEVVKNMLRSVAEDTILWAHPTNPFIGTKHYDDAICKYIENTCDSLYSATVIRDHFWYEDRPVNHNPWAFTHQVARELTPLMRQNGGIFIRPKSLMLEDGRFVGHNPIPYFMDELTGWDINEEWEMTMAQRMEELCVNSLA